MCRIRILNQNIRIFYNLNGFPVANQPIYVQLEFEIIKCANCLSGNGI